MHSVASTVGSDHTGADRQVAEQANRKLLDDCYGWAGDGKGKQRGVGRSRDEHGVVKSVDLCRNRRKITACSSWRFLAIYPFICKLLSFCYHILVNSRMAYQYSDFFIPSCKSFGKI